MLVRMWKVKKEGYNDGKIWIQIFYLFLVVHQIQLASKWNRDYM